ncbi:COBRA-like protein 6 isoform X2 [Syzygium oleosum]|uniref:COBRA-like protein 6 isoform X2 n=1 Tax=Syzygium oleosum TaxID=219896 RepID=UPI0011D23274|nr:COBRA-like protein 6 isoform X2 [Syzygium oleosum]
MGLVLMLGLIMTLYLASFAPLSYGYDPLDPTGNITIKWDIMQANAGGYSVKVSLFNYQLFRHVEPPGWRLSWTWNGDEVIWNMAGAQATLQGNCSRFMGNLPHSCEKKPVIVDLLPGAPYNMQVANCCKGGVLSSLIQDPSKYGATFQMSVGAASTYNASNTSSLYSIPANFTIELPGYTCGPPREVPPSRFTSDGGRRWTQAIGTWNVTCIYSQFRASLTPKCCVSLSAFYNSTIVPCPTCSCHCQGLPGARCANSSKLPPLLQLPHDVTKEVPPLVSCSQHMCPIKVHWHVKQSYREYWRVKITITNFNLAKNYSQWSLVMQHPNLRSLTQVFSFNYSPLDQHGTINDTGMFWGIQYYNEMLLQSGDNGNVQTEILLNKDAGMFTFREGWAFPRKISFNGDECVMPSPEDYPRLPNNANTSSFFRFILLNIPCLLILMFML